MTATPSPSLRRGPISTSVIYIPTWWARSSWKQQLAATPRSNATIVCINMDRSWTAGHDTMANGADAEKEKMGRFRDGALQHLDDLYTRRATSCAMRLTPKMWLRSATCGRCVISPAIGGQR